MELLITIAYIFLIRLIFFDYKLLRYNLFWKLVTFGIWIAAAMTEVILLGQFAPYSKEMFVQNYVIEIAPDFGGQVTALYVTPNQAVNEGDPLFQMDTEMYRNTVAELEAQLAAADTDFAELTQQVAEADAVVARLEANLGVTRLQYEQLGEAAARSAVSRLRMEQVEKEILVLEAELEGARAARRSAEIALESEVDDQPTAVATVLAELATARYNLEQRTLRAPADGYVTNVQLRPGAFIRLKQPVMSFVSTEESWLLATVPQRGVGHLRPGDKAEVAFEMYPGRLFEAEVENVIWAAGDSQSTPSGTLPHIGQIRGSELFMVKLRLTNPDPDFPPRFGSSGLAAMYSSDAADFLIVLRRIELQSESFLHYLYNPFG